LFSYYVMAMGRPFDLPYSVEVWDDNDQHIEELVALTGDFGIARAAYDEAIKRRPGRTITLRQKARVLADSRRDR
jgi:hypothetical protein